MRATALFLGGINHSTRGFSRTKFRNHIFNDLVNSSYSILQLYSMVYMPLIQLSFKAIDIKIIHKIVYIE